jgi:RimJ/RimL family protein N-acetyltransferase
MKLPDPPLSDDVVHLRQWTDEDAPELVRCCSDPLVPHYIPIIPMPYSLSDAEQFIERSRVPTDELNLAIAGHAGELFGAIGVSLKAYDPGIAETGYWLAPEARGRGLATRALRLLSVWTLRETDIARLQLQTDVENLASQAVATRAGFTREAVLRAYMDNRGTRRDSVMFSMIPGEA